MKIRFKLLEAERLGDAPFVGALLSAIDCHADCSGCFNQHIKLLPTVRRDSSDIISMVQQNPIHQGIIFGGLEWTEQPDELRAVVIEAVKAGLQVMIYTHLEEQEFKVQFPDLSLLPIWVKFGRYEAQSSSVVDPAGVTLASSNQYIMFMGEC